VIVTAACKCCLAPFNLEIFFRLLDAEQKLLQLIVSQGAVYPARGRRVDEIVFNRCRKIGLDKPDVHEPLASLWIEHYLQNSLAHRSLGFAPSRILIIWLLWLRD
jgi:hypothetical protein